MTSRLPHRNADTTSSSRISGENPHGWTVEIERPSKSPSPLLVSALHSQSYSRSASTDIASGNETNALHHHNSGVSLKNHQEKGVEVNQEDDQSSCLRRRRGFKRQDAMEARVRFNYIARQPGELSLHVGDVITVTDHSDFDWWIGSLPSGKSGMFPSNCCILDTSSAEPRKTESDKKESESSTNRIKKWYSKWVMKQKWGSHMHVFPRALFYLFICSVCSNHDNIISFSMLDMLFCCC